MLGALEKKNWKPVSWDIASLLSKETEPHWYGGNKKKRKHANHHATFNRNWWYVIAGVKRKRWRSRSPDGSAIKRNRQLTSRHLFGGK